MEKKELVVNMRSELVEIITQAAKEDGKTFDEMLVWFAEIGVEERFDIQDIKDMDMQGNHEDRELIDIDDVVKNM